MNRFLAGLVQRGAGLPAPVTLRPVPGFLHAPGPVEPTEGSQNLDANYEGGLRVEQAFPETESTRMPDFSRGIAPTLADSRSEISSTGVLPSIKTAAEAGRPGRPEPISAQPLPVVAIHESREGDSRTESGMQLTATTPHVIPLPTISTISNVSHVLSEPPRPSQKAEKGGGSVAPETAPPAVRANVVPRPESVPVLAPSHPEPARVPRHENKTSVPRTIQVKIGRVEIRSTQAPRVVRAAPKTISGGFAEFKLARTYLERSRG
jgi:hypothetical protein